ncbi:hypothetical protein [Jiangella alba]|uniref:Uncharacterized conserved protein, contains tandem ACT domains n=1 Tax=Jiangella alba TaxID=561176 RepID=A0A1H5IUD6_9ACTN|nr:hypothetical protein [Jiangella alba]SEE43760.1 Uncharacterized conserved protein, contains tandem ACT domains [Jiangella alba]
MSAFTIEFQNHPGRLADLCEVMAARDVNLVICGLAHGDSGTVAFIADDESAARSALRDAGLDATERDALTVRLKNAPGAGAATFRKLADAGVNVEVFLPVRVSDSQFVAVLCVDDHDAAAAVLGNAVA